MKTNFLIGAALTVLLAVSAHAAEPGKLTVKVNELGIRISPALYGIFFEEINCSGDGGIYAELVRNRSFEDSEKPDHWSLVCDDLAQADLAVDAAGAPGEYNKRALKFSVGAADLLHRAGVANEGYWGMSVEKNGRYDFSVNARGDKFIGGLYVSLENSAGIVYAQAKTENLSGDWKKQSVTLTSNATDPNARLVISVRQPGTVYLDMVSLFPKNTYNNR